jgi:hypothetical protein
MLLPKNLYLSIRKLDIFPYFFYANRTTIFMLFTLKYVITGLQIIAVFIIIFVL